MKRVKLVVAYDGQNYHGWQIQANAHTIEAQLNEALTTLFQTPIKVIGASRTDTGVHAEGNVAIFDVAIDWPVEKVKYALNQILPEDIRIQSSTQVADDWHPRYSKSKKTYEYHILNKDISLPTHRNYAYHFKHPLDVPKMQEACKHFLGEHDFQSFCAANSSVGTTVRTIYDLTITENNQELIITVCGNGFLYNMVRIIAGTLLEVGIGNISPDDIPKIILSKNRKQAGKTVPPQGLILKAYEFED